MFLFCYFPFQSILDQLLSGTLSSQIVRGVLLFTCKFHIRCVYLLTYLFFYLFMMIFFALFIHPIRNVTLAAPCCSSTSDILLEKLFHLCDDGINFTQPCVRVCAFIIPHPGFCVAQRRGGDGLSRPPVTAPHFSHEERTAPVNRLRWRIAVTPSCTISLINFERPGARRALPPHPALADMKYTGEASVCFQQQQQGLDVGCGTLDV